MSQEERKETYNHVLKAVIANTSENQPIGMARVRLLSNINQSNKSVEQGRKAIQAALDNEDLVKYCDSDGRIRYVPVTKDDLRELIEYLVNREMDTNRELVAKCNRLIQENAN